MVNINTVNARVRKRIYIFIVDLRRRGADKARARSVCVSVST